MARKMKKAEGERGISRAQSLRQQFAESRRPSSTSVSLRWAPARSGYSSGSSGDLTRARMSPSDTEAGAAPATHYAALPPSSGCLEQSFDSTCSPQVTRKWRMATSYLGESVQPGAARTSLTSPVLSTPTPLSSTPAEIGISCSSSFRSRQSHQISYSDHCNKLVGLVVIIVWLIGVSNRY